MAAVWIQVVDSDSNPIQTAEVRASTAGQRMLPLEREEDRWVGHGQPGESFILHASAEGFEPDTHPVVLRSEVNQVVIGLRRPGQLSYTYGDNRLAFQPVDRAFLVRVLGEGARRNFTRAAKKLEISWKPVAPGAPESEDDLFLRVEGDIKAADALSKELSRGNNSVEVSRIIQHGERLPVGLTHELVVRFAPDVKRPVVERIAAGAGMQVLREILHAGNAFLFRRAGLPSYDLLDAADSLARNDSVLYVEPNLTFVVEADAYTPNDTLWAQIPYLQLIDVDDAWDLLDNVSVNLRGGSPAITIAIIDPQGVAPNHTELTANLTDGTSKLVSSTNFAAAPIAAQTVAGLSGDHGTQCAGSATAAFDNNRGIAGVAPNCHLIGARIGGAINTVLMADIYLWVGGFLNGSTAAGFPTAVPARAADVISSSWGSTGLALSNTIRDCFDFLTTYGRGGRGCLVLFSLGNTGYLDFTSPTGGGFRSWPTYEKIIACGSSISTNPTNPIATGFHTDPNGVINNIATAVDTRALFSPFGAAALRKPDLVSPSHTSYNAAGNLVDPILALARMGTGAVDGCPGAPVCNDYATTFGGTSHSTPTIAGAVALILSARPNLSWVQVREILRQSCTRIDAAQANAIGTWQDLNGDGLIDYSRWYGAGRLDVDAAINLALDPALPLADVYVRENLADTGAVPSGGSWWASPDIWVRQDAATAIPVLAWGSDAPHQNARRGQNNAVFCRVRNQGTAAAPVTYVRAMITHWAGLEFVYPADFEPSTNVGAAIPNPLVPGTYLIGETRIDNLAAGADQIVKFVWQQALVPPETVIVGGATVRWHPCLLLEASPHDGPAPIGGLAVPVQGNNNIAQRNIAIINPGDADLFVGMIAGTRADVGIATLILDATRLRGATAIWLHIADERLLQQLETGLRRVVQNQPGQQSPGQECADCAVVVDQRTRLRVECGSCDIVIEAAPGTRILTGNCAKSEPLTVGWVKQQNLAAIEIRGLRGQIEIPLRLAGGQFAPLLAAVSGPAIGDLHITQRRGDGEVSPGYGIRHTS
jgi:subtilisin family serine protease